MVMLLLLSLLLLIFVIVIVFAVAACGPCCSSLFCVQMDFKQDLRPSEGIFSQFSSDLFELGLRHELEVACRAAQCHVGSIIRDGATVSINASASGFNKVRSIISLPSTGTYAEPVCCFCGSLPLCIC